jgi:hypothetical protein
VPERQVAAEVADLSGLLFVSSSVHIAATAGLFGFADVRRHAAEHKTRYLHVPLALVSSAGLIAAITPPHALSVVLLGYFGWQLFHYQKQNLGLAALAATASRVARLSQLERRAITVTALAGGLELALRPHVLQLGLTDPTQSWSVVIRAAAVVGYTATVAIGLLALSRRSKLDRPANLVAIYLMGLLFPAPIFIFGSPYLAVGVLTIAHGLQYLLVTGLVVGGPEKSQRPTRLAAFAALALGLGLVLNLGSHLHSGGVVARAGFGAYLGLVMTHFVVDGGLWRLRDPFPRRFVGSRIPRLLAPPRPVEA